VYNFPVAISPAAGRAETLLFFAANGDGLLKFPAISAICCLVSVGWRDRAKITAIRIFPGCSGTGAGYFQ